MLGFFGETVAILKDSARLFSRGIAKCSCSALAATKARKFKRNELIKTGNKRGHESIDNETRIARNLPSV